MITEIFYKHFDDEDREDNFLILLTKPTLKEEIMSAMEEYADQFRVNEWIPVSERLPENRKVVLIHWAYEGRELTTSGSYNHDGQYWQHGNATQMKVTHWMPLPEPPKQIHE
jgi:hypothetical protein